MAGKVSADISPRRQALDVVCLHLANDVTYPILVLGILASGCRWTGTNTVYTSHELAHHFRTSQTKSVVVAAEHLEIVETAVAASDPSIEVILFTDILTLGATGEPAGLQNGGRSRTITDILQPPSLAKLRNYLDAINDYEEQCGTGNEDGWVWWELGDVQDSGVVILVACEAGLEFDVALAHVLYKCEDVC